MRWIRSIEEQAFDAEQAERDKAGEMTQEQKDANEKIFAAYRAEQAALWANRGSSPCIAA